MITLLTGDDSFEIEQHLRALKAEAKVAAETFDGASLEINDLADLFLGATLFSSQRLIVIRNLSQNKAIWNELSSWLDRLDPENDLVLVESNLDKRSKAYKSLQKTARILELKTWRPGDEVAAQNWANQRAQQKKLPLDFSQIKLIVRRTGGEKWAIEAALQKLLLLDKITTEKIEQLIEPAPTANIFELLNAALDGDQTRVRQMISDLRFGQDAHAALGLIAGQAFNLSVLLAADSQADVAKDFAIHPFVLSKLRRYVQKINKATMSKIIDSLSQADLAIKTASLEPWAALELSLSQIANLAKGDK